MKREIFLKWQLFVWVFGAWVTTSFAQSASVEQYISTYKSIAISEMKRTGVPASITLAQGILESGFGTSKLAVKGNNHFGIKADKTWSGPVIRRKGARYRKYSSAVESYRDHSDFLKNRSRYAFLFNYPPFQYKKWARGLKKAGYATASSYPKRLISLIERYDLYQYDK
ncbi:MAG: glucosaminidase domain-containing protein [Bacteroidota bacterium]